MAKIHEGLVVVLAMTTITLVVIATLPGTRWYLVSLPRHSGKPIPMTWKTVRSNGPESLWKLYRLSVSSLAIAAISQVALVVVVVVGMAKRTWTHEAATRHMVSTRILAVCGLVGISFTVIAFLWHPNAMRKTNLCTGERPVGPCASFRGSSSFGSWGPCEFLPSPSHFPLPLPLLTLTRTHIPQFTHTATGWTISVISGISSAMTISMAWAIHRSASFFPFNEF